MSERNLDDEVTGDDEHGGGFGFFTNLFARHLAEVAERFEFVED